MGTHGEWLLATRAIALEQRLSAMPSGHAAAKTAVAARLEANDCTLDDGVLNWNKHISNHTQIQSNTFACHLRMKA